MFSWNNIRDMFDELDASRCSYLILRNYEEITESNFCCTGHADIDFLVSDNRKFVSVLHAFPRFAEDDGIHYIVNISGEEVIIDVRTVGDGYYATNWQKEMLACKVAHVFGFFTMDAENYYYSLVYHAILQKTELSDEYLIRLNDMAADLEIPAKNADEHLERLNEFMEKHGYYYTFPYDIWVPLNVQLIDTTRVKKGIKVYTRDIKIWLMRIGSRIKHKLIG